MPTDIGLPPYLVGLCTRSVYGLADAPRRWWNRLGKFLIALGIQPLRADRCTSVCYDGAFKEPSKVAEATEPSPVTYYVSSQESEVTQHESSDIAEEVHKSLLVEERLFSACYQQPLTWKQRTEFKQKKVEDCAWTPVVDETLLIFFGLCEHKPGWYPVENGHAQVSYRVKALRTSDQYYDRKKFHLRTSIVKRGGVLVICASLGLRVPRVFFQQELYEHIPHQNKNAILAVSSGSREPNLSKSQDKPIQQHDDIDKACVGS